MLVLNVNETKRDVHFWAKKFDEVKHIYATPNPGTLCGSVAHCLGNNYATTDMKVCPKCLEIQQSNK